MTKNDDNLWDSISPEGDYDSDESILSPLARDTEKGWRHITRLCERNVAIGFGSLDSFLSGPDLEKRIALVEKESQSNEWLRFELRDTLGLDQSKDWSEGQIKRLTQIAFMDSTGADVSVKGQLQ